MHNELTRISLRRFAGAIHHYALLKFPNRGVGVPPEVLVHFHPERHDQVNNDGRAKRQKRSIDEVKTNTTG